MPAKNHFSDPNREIALSTEGMYYESPLVKTDSLWAHKNDQLIRRQVELELQNAKEKHRTPRTEYFKSPRQYVNLSTLCADLSLKYPAYFVGYPEYGPAQGYMIGLYVLKDTIVPIVVPLNFPSKMLDMFGDHIPVEKLEEQFSKYQPEMEVINE